MGCGCKKNVKQTTTTAQTTETKIVEQSTDEVPVVSNMSSAEIKSEQVRMKFFMSSDASEARHETCKANLCGMYDEARDRCRKCGCYLKYKTKLAKSKCPLGYW